MRNLKFRQFLDGKFHYWGYIDKAFISPLTNTEAHDLESQQFTGLLDKSGKEIYEGDIYRLKTEFDIHDLSKDYTWTDSRVLENLQDFFENKGYRESEMGEEWTDKNIEVIGNVWENPELLK